ncbi:uncharacterized protein SCHCODRAFT_01160013 [Schizophyllum commune H4-8]|nr:uncharacterized protein SCHCODRAFT_01160013 [Schizophyllum commune H4-8]KAI5887442.1 hypothetical protein SCHCODRAFT_01160013 [Schizophyllum commune H4-8]
MIGRFNASTSSDLLKLLDDLQVPSIVSEVAQCHIDQGASMILRLDFLKTSTRRCLKDTSMRSLRLTIPIPAYGSLTSSTRCHARASMILSPPNNAEIGRVNDYSDIFPLTPTSATTPICFRTEAYEPRRVDEPHKDWMSVKPSRFAPRINERKQRRASTSSPAKLPTSRSERYLKSIASSRILHHRALQFATLADSRSRRFRRDAVRAHRSSSIIMLGFAFQTAMARSSLENTTTPDQTPPRHLQALHQPQHDDDGQDEDKDPPNGW